MRCRSCGVELGDAVRCSSCGASAPGVEPEPRSGSFGAPADAERRQLTVLFGDLVGSTTLSERMDPEDYRALLREYQSRCATVVRQHRGHLAQFLGDGIMVYFGYPAAQERAARDAVDAGLELVRMVMSMEAEQRLPAPLRARVGIHSGLVVVGEMGDPAQPQRLAVGATPNVAARAQAEADDNSVFITESTHRLVAGYFECEAAGERRVKSLSQPVRFFRVLSQASATSRFQGGLRRGVQSLVGRKSELSAINELWAGRGEGPPRGVVLVGEPGIGKSRLAQEFTDSLKSVNLLDCSAVEHHESAALFPVLRLLERWAERLDDRSETSFRNGLDALGLSDSAAELVNVHAMSRGEAGAIASLPTARAYQRTLEALRRFIVAIGRGESVLLVEDVHWLDPSTRALLGGLQGAGLPFVLATARPEADLEWAKQASLRVIEIGRLEAPVATELARLVVKSVQADLPAGALAQLVERAEGVPLFIEEITRDWVEGGGELPAVERSALPDALKIPHALRDPLAARLDRLGEARPLAQMAAVLGRQFPLSWLSGLAGASEEVVAAELVPLVAAGLVYRLPGTEPSFAFSHAMIRDAAYETLTRGVRADYHSRLAEIIETRYPEAAARDPLLLSHHSAEGGDIASAAGHLLRAARVALANAAFTEALEITARSLELIRRASDARALEAIETEVLAARGLALISTRGYSATEVEEVYARAAQLCEARGDVPLHVLYGVWAVHLVRADVRRVNGLAQLLERKLSDCTSDEKLVVHACLGVRANYRVMLDEGRGHFEACVRAFSTEDPSMQHRRLLGIYGFESSLSGHFWLAWMDAQQGHTLSARQRVRDTWALTEKIGDPYMSCQVAVYFATLFRELGDPEAGGYFVEQALKLAAEHEYVFWQALAMCNQAWLMAERGSFDDALANVTMGLGILDAAGSVINRGYFQSYLVDVHLARGEAREALAAADRGLTMCRESLGPQYEPELLRQKAIALDRLGDAAAAEDHFRAALSVARLQGMRLIELRAARDLAVRFGLSGRTAEAAELFARVCSDWPEGAAAPELARARSVVDSAGPQAGAAQ